MARPSFKTKSGKELSIMNLKGKEYLPVAQRLLWFVDENSSYQIETHYPVLTENNCVANTTITLIKEDGTLIKRVTGTKQESKAGFGDFIEKAQTGALGRALAMLGYGTQFTADEFDEADRIVDAPIERPATASASSSGPVVSTFSNSLAAKKDASKKASTKTSSATDL